MLISMHLILGWASFCMNYCINAAWHGDNQPVALLRCNEARVALIAAFRSSELLGLVSLIFLLTIDNLWQWFSKCGTLTTSSSGTQRNRRIKYKSGRVSTKAIFFFLNGSEFTMAF